MPLTPDSTAQPETRGSRFRRRLWLGLFAVLAFEIGAFLVVFPWMDSWSLNHLPALFPSIQSDLQDLWDEPLLKGAISLLGLLNVYIAFLQVFRLIRSGRQA
jgi:hypothetical protein